LIVDALDVEVFFLHWLQEFKLMKQPNLQQRQLDEIHVALGEYTS